MFKQQNKIMLIEPFIHMHSLVASLYKVSKFRILMIKLQTLDHMITITLHISFIQM